MKKIRVELRKSEDRSYDIMIGEDLLDYIENQLVTSTPAHSYAVITDSNVEQLYGKDLYEKLRDSLPAVEIISFPAGEENKNRQYKEMIEDVMLDNNFGRDSAIIALGGGVVGDLAGFVAATYCRGIPYIQIPTTLVACVDSSVGGKTAVDTKHGKNLIGSFHQPWKVIIDVSSLVTLPYKEMQEGMAEVIKYGVISDRELFALVENELEGIYKYDMGLLSGIIEKSCRIKAQVVEKDERESDLRKILNFGHTIGHALENLSSYKLTHGRAISIGMILEGKIAEEMGYMHPEDLLRLTDLVKKSGLPVKPPENLYPGKVIQSMKLDKKSRGGSIEMALPASIGKMMKGNNGYGIKVEESVISEILKNNL